MPEKRSWDDTGWPELAPMPQHIARSPRDAVYTTCPPPVQAKYQQPGGCIEKGKTVDEGLRYDKRIEGVPITVE